MDNPNPPAYANINKTIAAAHWLFVKLIDGNRVALLSERFLPCYHHPSKHFEGTAGTQKRTADTYKKKEGVHPTIKLETV